jgi:hypothetical protein
MVIGSVVAILAPPGECEAGGKKVCPHLWYAADSSWGVGGFGRLRPGLAEEVMAKKPLELDGLRIYEMEVREPAVYLSFVVGLRRVEKVVFTKSSRFVLTDKDGKRVESEAIFFCPDYLQTSLYDSRKCPIVVTKTSVWCNPRTGDPAGWVKFPAGSIELKSIGSFEVVGAIVDTLQRAAK